MRTTSTACANSRSPIFATSKTSTRRTSHNARRGKAGYMAPSYVASGEVAAECDLFPLGVMLWEALTGQRLFPQAKSLEDVRRNHEAPVPEPSLLAPRLAPEWDELCLRALGHHTGPRFKTAAAFGRALEELTREQPASRQDVARLVERVAHDTLWLRRRIVKERLRASFVDQSDQISGIHELPTRPEFPEATLDLTPSAGAEAAAPFDAPKEMERFLPPRARGLKTAALVFGGAAIGAATLLFAWLA